MLTAAVRPTLLSDVTLKRALRLFHILEDAALVTLLSSMILLACTQILMRNLFNEAFIEDQSALMQNYRKESEGRIGGEFSRRAIFFPEHNFGREWEFSFTYKF